MSPLAVPLAALGSTAFAALAWGSVGLVLVVFAYVVRQLVDERRRGRPPRQRE